MSSHCLRGSIRPSSRLMLFVLIAFGAVAAVAAGTARAAGPAGPAAQEAAPRHTLAGWAQLLVLAAEQTHLEFTTMTLRVKHSAVDRDPVADVEVLSPARFHQLAILLAFKSGEATLKTLPDSAGKTVRSASFTLALEPDPRNPVVLDAGPAPVPFPRAGGAAHDWIMGLANLSARPGSVSIGGPVAGSRDMTFTYSMTTPGSTRAAVALGKVDGLPGPTPDQIVVAPGPRGWDVQVTGRLPVAVTSVPGHAPPIVGSIADGVTFKTAGSRCTMQGTVHGFEALAGLVLRALSLSGMTAVGALRASRRGDSFDILGELRF